MKGRKGGRMMNDAPRETPRQPNNCWTARHVAYARTAWQRTDYTLDEVGVMCDVQAQTVAKWLNVRLDGTPLSTPPRPAAPSTPTTPTPAWCSRSGRA